LSDEYWRLVPSKRVGAGAGVHRQRALPFQELLAAPAAAEPQAPTCATNQGGIVSINLELGPIVALIAGILILVVPRLLNYIVAIYLIIIGLVGIFGWSGTHFRPTAVDNGSVAPVRVVAAVAVPSSRR